MRETPWCPVTMQQNFVGESGIARAYIIETGQSEFDA